MVPAPDRYAVTERHRELLDPATIDTLANPDREFHPSDLAAVFETVAGDRDPELFPDGKLLPDSYPLHSLGEIGVLFAEASEREDFDPRSFWGQHFELPDYSLLEAGGETPTELDAYISSMWEYGRLTYHSAQNRGTLIGTPYPHLKPGERFTEGYYWDLKDGVSGLLAEAGTASDTERKDKENLVLGVAGNLIYQVENFGYVPNGLRTYYLGRSQPPVFAGIVKEMAEYFGERRPHLVEDYLPALTKEYEWWMRGEEETATPNGPAAHLRVVRMPDGSVLNRHWDEGTGPRPESYWEDSRTAAMAEGREAQDVFRHIRAGAESGKDHSARFMEDPERLETTHAADFATPELNSLLWEYEDLIATAHDRAGRSVLAAEFHERADRRRDAMLTYLWNEAEGTFYDFDFAKGEQSTVKTMGMAYPVARGIALPEQALRVASVLRKDMLMRGGFVSAAIESPQQWDHPNGFARDQVEGVNALLSVDSNVAAMAANIAARRWLRSDQEIFMDHGVLVEKNNVVSPRAQPGSGGEYSVQRGFLWTNGVHRVLQGRLDGSLV